MEEQKRGGKKVFQRLRNAGKGKDVANQQIYFIK